jgi:two-component system, OmpR family, alkaline phosphatase synthesis response regulator PhoP
MSKTNGRGKILVCDDDSGILEAIEIILSSNDYEVKTLSTGKGIVKIIKEYQPGLILLDIWMPQVDGTEITKVLKQDPATKNIPIVIISALNDIDKIAKTTGADGTLSKPFMMKDLLKTVETKLKKN